MTLGPFGMIPGRFRPARVGTLILNLHTQPECLLGFGRQRQRWEAGWKLLSREIAGVVKTHGLSNSNIDSYSQGIIGRVREYFQNSVSICVIFILKQLNNE